MSDQLLARAFVLALNAHEGQKYGERDYIQHVYDVSTHVSYLYAYSHVLSAAAYLHDVVEDSSYTLDGIYHALGHSMDSSRVIDILRDLTKTEGLPLENYLHVIKSRESSRLVKVSDTMANLVSSYHDGNERRIRKYADQLTYLLGVNEHGLWELPFVK